MALWLLFALGTALFWGVGQVLSKKGFENISPLWSNIFSSFIGIFVWIPSALIGSHFHIQQPSFLLLIFIFLTGVCYLSYYYAISKGNLALTGTLFETYPIFTILLSVTLLHEHITFLQIHGILITIIGSLLLVWPSKNDVKTIRNYIWVFWGLAGALLEGIGDFLSKVTVNALGAYSQMFYLVILFQIVLLLNYFLDKKGRSLPKFSLKIFLPSILGTTLVVLGTALLFFAFQYGEASLITPITASSPVIVVLLAIFLLKEKVTRLQLFGIAVVIIGVVLVGI